MASKTNDIGLVEDPRFRDHRGPEGHPERPARLEAVDSVLDLHRSDLQVFESRQASDDELLRVHTREHLEIVAHAASRAPTQIDADTYVCAQSHAVARLAAGSTIDLALAVADGHVRQGIASVRPPGHHAEARGPMGFCLFNNIALAVRALQIERGVERILVLDWDVHHGNGTQHTFESSPSVLYASTHQFPFYPGTGAATEAGIGAGLGATLNIPLPPGCGDAEYVGALQRLVAPAARSFRPEMILISCGFDAHADDPLAAMQVSGQGFADMTAIVRDLAEDLCGGRLVFVLEGGYAESGLRAGMQAVVADLIDRPALPAVLDVPAGSALASVIGAVSAVHERHFEGLGNA